MEELKSSKLKNLINFGFKIYTDVKLTATQISKILGQKGVHCQGILFSTSPI